MASPSSFAPPATRLQDWLVPLVLIGVAASLPLYASNYYVQFASKVLLIGTAAMALNLCVGFGGMVSMCHSAFFGLAGYVLALASPQYEAASLWLSLPLAIAASALVALVIGALSLRTKGIYFIMVTLAFGEMLFYLFHDTKIAGGSDGAYIYVKPEAMIGAYRLFDLENKMVFHLFSVAIVALCWLLLTRLTTSHFGHALMAARDNERRARSLGFNVFRVRLTAFALSGAIAGVAGYLSAAQFGTVAPQLLGWHMSAMLLVIVVLGGMKSVSGPLVGALVLMGLEEVLKAQTEYWKLIEGLIVIAIVLFLPGGVRDLIANLGGRDE